MGELLSFCFPLGKGLFASCGICSFGTKIAGRRGFFGGGVYYYHRSLRPEKVASRRNKGLKGDRSYESAVKYPSSYLVHINRAIV